MSDQDADAWKWSEMQEMSGRLRRASAKAEPTLAIVVSDFGAQLVESGFFKKLSVADMKMFTTLIKAAADY